MNYNKKNLNEMVKVLRDNASTYFSRTDNYLYNP